jgi:PAS domain S-box-containing protein
MQEDTLFLKRRSDQLFKSEMSGLRRRTDRMFAVLLFLQWLGGIALASWYSPHRLVGRVTTLNIELMTAIFLGGAIIALPLFLIFRKPGMTVTREVVSAAQMLSSGLLVHLSGGHSEMHFHIFGSLAFLAFYRDWKVLAIASTVVSADYFLRGVYWPQSVYGTAMVVPWRWLEDTAWVLFEDIFLIYACWLGNREVYAGAQRRAELEDSQTSVERTVSERTAQLAQSNRDLNRQIGERQRVEQELRTARDQLESNVRERTAELNAANRALKRQIEDGRKTEDELARSMQRYRFMTDSMPQMVWTATPDGRLDYFNRRFHEYTGLTADESREWGWKPATHPDDLARCVELWNQAVTTGEIYDVECRLRRGEDSAYRWHLSRAVPMRDPDNRIIQWFGTCTDIDDQKRSKEKITRSEQRYRSLVAASTQIVWLTDAEGRVTGDLPEWRAATGQTYQEVQKYGWLDAIHFDDRERTTDLWKWALETKTVFESEYQLRMADGSYRNFAARGVPVLEPDGRVREWIGTSTDVTEKMQAEEVVRRAQEELEGRVRERTAQLTETNRVLHQQVIERKQIEDQLAEARDDALNSAKLKSQFLANMSHEIRTPMNGVIGMTSLLLDTPLNEEQREYIETIRASGDALLSIINDILDFSKIEAGKLDFEELDLDLQSTVEGAIELLAEKAQAKGLDLACHVLEDVPRQLCGDPGRLRQVLVNLVGNAIKFTPSGRVLVHVAKLEETASNAQICFQVSDTGIGLSEEAARGLFQAFVQADGSTTRKFGGTGLGLAISKQLVELMGGQIGVESAPDQGSTFWFTVRLAKQPILVADEEPLAEATTDFSLARAVIVGSSGTREVLREQLTAWGMPVLALAEGKEALAALRDGVAEDKPWNFVIVDTHLPDMDGLALAHAIKDDPKTAPTRVVMLLAPGQRAGFTSGEKSDVSAVLNKPVKRSQLRELFRAALAQKAAQPAAAPAKPAAPVPRPVKGKGVRVLIAEDNQVNQKVVIRQLQKIGYKADAVANGIETLEATSKVVYDVILMDCQMPEMDGFTATREIRRREAAAGAHTPIVALTANALEGDRERCLAAGMDDYLSKPIKLEALQALLERWTTAVGKDPEKEKVAGPPADEDKEPEKPTENHAPAVLETAA